MVIRAFARTSDGLKYGTTVRQYCTGKQTRGNKLDGSAGSPDPSVGLYDITAITEYDMTFDAVTARRRDKLIEVWLARRRRGPRITVVSSLDQLDG